MKYTVVKPFLLKDVGIQLSVSLIPVLTWEPSFWKYSYCLIFCRKNDVESRPPIITLFNPLYLFPVCRFILISSHFELFLKNFRYFSIKQARITRSILSFSKILNEVQISSPYLLYKIRWNRSWFRRRFDQTLFLLWIFYIEACGKSSLLMRRQKALSVNPP